MAANLSIARSGKSSHGWVVRSEVIQSAAAGLRYSRLSPYHPPVLLRPSDFSRRLLGWYDTAHRDLPWRVRGVHPAPYHVLVSEFMLQQTQVATVIPYFERFLAQFP